MIHDSILESIVPEWDDDNFEYGVCTGIDSHGNPQQESGLCPAPLSCQLRRDKYVCSCGRDQYLSENGTSCCKYLYFREKKKEFEYGFSLQFISWKET